MSYFSASFIKQITPKSTFKYVFSSTAPLASETERDKFKSLCVETTYVYDENGALADELENPTNLKRVFDQWLLDCSGCFVKSPTFEKFKYSSQSALHDAVSVDNIDTDKKSYVYSWYPVKIELDVPMFKVHWAIVHKAVETPTTADTKIRIDDDEPEVQVEEHMYMQQPDGTRFITTKDGARTEWLQELNDVSLPFSDSPALRLEMEHDEVHREKFRRRVRESRIRAKLARYRAERLAQRYEERYGVYPDEDAEEAQTEAEQSDDE